MTEKNWIREVERILGLPYLYFCMGMMLMMDLQLLCAIIVLPKLFSLLRNAGLV